MADTQEPKVDVAAQPAQDAEQTAEAVEATKGTFEKEAEPSSPGDTKDSSAASKDDPSPPRRPLTRSQTGTVPKRRSRDDSDAVAEQPKKRASVSRKRQKTASAPAEDRVEPQPQDSASVSSPQPPSTREVSLPASTASAPQASGANQITFYHTPSTSEDQADCRLPRSRASLPTPIPNLTKKSRGRRVPTQDSGNTDPEKKDDRLYVCTVDGCGKCFHRGEHLKRHIRSIHTHEKPFKCTFPLCQKYFNRHDNLLQHLKVHRDPAPKEPVAQPPPTAPVHRHASTSTSSPHPRHHHQRSYSPVEEPESPIAPAEPRTIYNAFPRTTYSTPYPTSNIAFSSNNDSINLLASMAVSSLRTELPQSPIESRGSALRSSLY
ncbi:hypothetical protein JR316_0009661 [Psilocybe cubensis]|uniref:C2H2-type domain-containing protein n=2 Tax=Psilocybe cubensis TaxID=181762 RepID=A0A8H7XPZ4_PSICU|nr:hypothetical protein JR316_0009661 [Psilocybe cubensis]KAH9477448.1 hypothetical protein JR316_0009661 [Psilocybe cubensis]